MSQKLSTLSSLALTLATIALFSSSVVAQQPNEKSQSSKEITAADEQATTQAGELSALGEKLHTLVKAKTQTSAKITELQDALRSTEALGREEQLKADLKESVSLLEQLSVDFDELVSGASPRRDFNEDSDQVFSWSEELRVVLSPLINEIRKLTETPRQRSALLEKREALNTRGSQSRSAREKIAELLASIEDQEIRTHLQETDREWQEVSKEISAKLGVVNHKLEEMDKERVSLYEGTVGIFRKFFKSRGRNFLITILACVGFWFGFRALLTGLFASLPAQKKSGFTGRLVQVMKPVGGVLGTTGVFMLCLYLLGDWVLLTLAVLLLLGLLWSLKEAVPLYSSQIALLLNMGPVREGELLTYNGLTWKVTDLSFYTKLSNPRLQGGELRLPLKDLLDKRSRKIVDEERWFPTSVNDWILMDGTTPAKVLSQTPDTVVLEKVGGENCTTPASAFFSSSPAVISKGFRIAVIFGIDYRFQEELFDSIVPTLQEYLERAVEESPHSLDVKNLVVDFQSAAASSLNMVAVVDCYGSAAPKHPILKRFIEKSCVTAATANGWDIPFDQLSLHVETMPTAKTA